MSTDCQTPNVRKPSVSLPMRHVDAGYVSQELIPFIPTVNCWPTCKLRRRTRCTRSTTLDSYPRRHRRNSNIIGTRLESQSLLLLQSLWRLLANSTPSSHSSATIRRLSRCLPYRAYIIAIQEETDERDKVTQFFLEPYGGLLVGEDCSWVVSRQTEVESKMHTDDIPHPAASEGCYYHKLLK
jgi:hypothetical protein